MPSKSPLILRSARQRASRRTHGVHATISVDDLIEARGRGLAHVDEAVMDLHDGKAALDAAIALEAEDTVDAGKAGRVGEGCGREIRPLRAARRQDGQQG